jgi:uncharacterized protein
MKIIIDTNIHISALAFGGSISKNLILLYEHSQIKIFTSDAIYQELKEKLSSPKFAKITKGKVPNSEVEQYLLDYINESQFVEPSQVVKICRDSDDDMFLELALEIGADYILTGDKDLLSIGQFENTKISTMADFVKETEI